MFASCGAGVPGLYSPCPGACTCRNTSKHQSREERSRGRRTQEKGKQDGVESAAAAEGGLQSPVARGSRVIIATETFGLQEDSRSAAVERVSSRQDAGEGGMQREWVHPPFSLTLAVAQTAQALPHLPCWLLEPRPEERAETGSTLRRFITYRRLSLELEHTGRDLPGGNVGFSRARELCVR